MSQYNYLALDKIGWYSELFIKSSSIKKPTYYGTEYNDLYLGKDIGEYYFGRSGDDFLSDGDGADVMYGEAGRDEFLVTPDNYHDIFIGGSGTDFFYAQLGRDNFFGGDVDGTDSEFDLIDYRYCSKAIKAELVTGYITDVDKTTYDWAEGIEGVRGSAFNDTLKGSNLNNELYGDAGNDRLYGYGGDDYISGGAGNDHMYGGDDHDALHGWDGRDYIEGGKGSDYINGGRGNDTISLGSGDNVFVFSKGHGKDTLLDLIGEGDNIIRLQGFDERVSSFADIMHLASDHDFRFENSYIYWTEIDLPGGDQLKLRSVRKSELSDDMFEFL